MASSNDTVSYEAFGAVGDGVHDDLPAICQAHEHANAHGLSIRTKPDATYHVGSQDLTAIIATDTDWNTSRFTIDDTRVDNNKQTIFAVRSLLKPMSVQIDRLTRDQPRIDIQLERDCYVLAENDRKRVYIRKGLNQNNGVPQHDCFVLRRNGSIEGDIDWNYDTITRIEAHPIDEKRLFLRGGIFTTIANRMKQEIGYNYWARNIVVTRSNTEIDGLTHYVVGETSIGHPYHGFIIFHQCADITLRNGFATGHRMYWTIGSAGKPVPMGSYDYCARNVVNFQMLHCRMNHICDRSRWGVMESDFCKNILIEDCTLSRTDTHMGVSGKYVIRRCTLGHMGINAVGRGQLIIEDSTLHGNSIVNLRGDYGSTWEGDVLIRNCRWIPACGETHWPRLVHSDNDGMHDFGYVCYMPRTVTVDGLSVDDRNHPPEFQGMYFLADPDSAAGKGNELPPMADRPFPYHWCRTLRVRGLTTASGKKPMISPNVELQKTTVVLENW